MINNKLTLHPYLNAANWVRGGSCVFWTKETHVVAKYEQMQKDLERATPGLLMEGQPEKSFHIGTSTLSLT